MKKYILLFAFVCSFSYSQLFAYTYSRTPSGTNVDNSLSITVVADSALYGTYNPSYPYLIIELGGNNASYFASSPYSGDGSYNFNFTLPADDIYTVTICTSSDGLSSNCNGISLGTLEELNGGIDIIFSSTGLAPYVATSQLTGIVIPQGNPIQQLLSGTAYTVTCKTGGVYFRGWTGSGSGTFLQNNCGSGFSQNLSPAVYQFTVQDSSGFNNIDTFNVEIVSSYYCYNGGTDYPTCTPPPPAVHGCMDTRATNYVASSTINDIACTYPFKSYLTPFSEPITRFGNTPYIVTTPTLSGFSYATETFSGTPYLTNGASPVQSVQVTLRYPLNTPIKYLYMVATSPFYAGNFIRGCGGQYLGGGETGMSQIGTGFLTPDEVQVYVYRATMPNNMGNCVQFDSFVQSPSAQANTRVYSMWASADSGITPLTFEQVPTASTSTTPVNTGTSTGDYTFYSSNQVNTSNIFSMGSTTISFGALDLSACDITSVTLNPFATTSLGWGTFNIPNCGLQGIKFVLFGTNGFDTYNITNFINTSSSSLPFLMFKFMSGALIYINPLTGELINLPQTATTSLTFSVPLFGTSTAGVFKIPIMASTTFLSGITVPVTLDKTLATLEFVFFALMWAIIFKNINV